MRKLLALLIPLLTSIPLSAETFTIGPLTYYCSSLSSSTSVSVDDCEANASGELIIPESVEYRGKTYSVTNIGSAAFSWCRSLTSVSIPSSVTGIGVRAFYHCLSLTSVSIPSSVTYIGGQAFSFCSNLTYIQVESGNPN